MTFPDGWSQDLDILWGALSSLWQATMWFCPAGIMNRRGAREGSYGGPLSSMWQGEKWEQEEVKDRKMVPHDCSIWYPCTGCDGKGIGWWWLEKKMVEPKVMEGWGWHRTEVGIITGVKEPGAFRWNRKISQIYGKDSIEEADSEPGAKIWGKEINVSLHLWHMD